MMFLGVVLLGNAQSNGFPIVATDARGLILRLRTQRWEKP
jgi:hypothetical protein